MLNGIPVVPVVIIVLGALAYLFRNKIAEVFARTKSQAQAQADQVQAEVQNAVNQAQEAAQAKVDEFRAAVATKVNEVKTDVNNLTK